jgi:hypothetical protein
LSEVQLAKTPGRGRDEPISKLGVGPLKHAIAVIAGCLRSPG